MHIFQNLFPPSRQNKPSLLQDTKPPGRKKRFDFTCGTGSCSLMESSTDNADDRSSSRISCTAESTGQTDSLQPGRHTQGNAPAATSDRIDQIAQNSSLTAFCGVTGHELTPIGFCGAPMKDFGDISVKYFELRRFLGRGGKIRMYLRLHRIRHIYESIELTTESQCVVIGLLEHLMSTGISPTGQLPILTHGTKALCETTAILRYLARISGEYGACVDMDYYADMVMDKLSYWTDELMAAISDANAGKKTTPAVYQYLNSRSDYFILFERVFEYLEGSMKTVSRQSDPPPWFICATTTIIFDDMQLLSLLGRQTEECLQFEKFNLLRTHFYNVMGSPLLRELWREKEAFRSAESAVSGIVHPHRPLEVGVKHTDTCRLEKITTTAHTTASESEKKDGGGFFDFQTDTLMTRRGITSADSNPNHARMLWMQQMTQKESGENVSPYNISLLGGFAVNEQQNCPDQLGITLTRCDDIPCPETSHQNKQCSPRHTSAYWHSVPTLPGVANP